MVVEPPPRQADARRCYPRRGAHAEAPLLVEHENPRDFNPYPGQAAQIVHQPAAHTQKYGLEISVRGAKPPPPNEAQRRLMETLEQSPQEGAAAVIEKAESAIRDGELNRGLWEDLEEKARGALHGMGLPLLIRCLRVFLLSGYQDVERLYTRIASQAAPLLGEASSGQLVTLLHWMSRAGLRDATVINLCGNEILIRTTHDFVTEMFIEVLNAHALLDARHPQLTQECTRELVSAFSDFSKEQCAQVAPLTVLTVMSDSTRMAFLSRCADLQMAQPVNAYKESVVHQFRLLQLAIDAEHRPAQMPGKVNEWLDRIKRDADAFQKSRPKAQLSRTEKDVYRVLEQVIGLQTTPSKQVGVFTLHLALEATKHCFEVLKRDHFFVSPSPTHHAPRPEVKLRHRLLIRQGWKPVVIREAEWWEWLDDDERTAKLKMAMESSHRSKMTPQ